LRFTRSRLGIAVLPAHGGTPPNREAPGIARRCAAQYDTGSPGGQRAARPVMAGRGRRAGHRGFPCGRETAGADPRLDEVAQPLAPLFVLSRLVTAIDGLLGVRARGRKGRAKLRLAMWDRPSYART